MPTHHLIYIGPILSRMTQLVRIILYNGGFWWELNKCVYSKQTYLEGAWPQLSQRVLDFIFSLWNNGFLLSLSPSQHCEVPCIFK